MAILRYLLLFVEVLVCFLLIGAILLQKSKSQGAGMMFGSGVGESLFGGQVGNVLTKVTVILAAIFLLTTTALAFLGANRSRASIVDGIVPGPPRPEAAAGAFPSAGTDESLPISAGAEPVAPPPIAAPTE